MLKSGMFLERRTVGAFGFVCILSSPSQVNSVRLSVRQLLRQRSVTCSRNSNLQGQQ